MVMQRYIRDEIVRHFKDNRQMVLLSGPRQVGKTTLARRLGEESQASRYFNWDDPSHREMILKGPSKIADELGLDRLMADKPLCVFDELHRFGQWRDFLKGLFDQYEHMLRLLVIGSASLGTFARGGDSLMGRYFPYRLHPLSVAEILNPAGPESVNRQPMPIDNDSWQALLNFGGFPEPYLKASDRFYRRWRNLRTQQLIREDLRDLTRIQELGQVEMLAEMLRRQVGQLTSYSYLAKSVRVSVDTIRRWIATLEALYFCFRVRPWFKNVTRALRKEPKYYLWDWSQIDDAGARAENLIACALLKSVHWWTDMGQGQFDLYHLRDKQKREVDFLVTQDDIPWMLVEAKRGSNAELSAALGYFQQQTKARHAFQVALDAEYVDRDCFELSRPTVVPARTFLSQLV